MAQRCSRAFSISQWKIVEVFCVLLCSVAWRQQAMEFVLTGGGYFTRTSTDCQVKSGEILDMRIRGLI